MLDKVIEKDIKKQKGLENAGFVVMRFTDNEVLKGIEGVEEKIKDKITEITKWQFFGLPSPALRAPPPKGDIECSTLNLRFSILISTINQKIISN